MKKLLLILCCPVLCFLSCRQAGDAVVEALLKKEASEFNKTGGKMVDDQTRLDSFHVQSGHTLVYHYTLINYNLEDLDTMVLKKHAEPDIKNSVRTNKELQTLRNHEVYFLYVYHDKKGRYVLSIPVNPEDYKSTKRQRDIK